MSALTNKADKDSNQDLLQSQISSVLSQTEANFRCCPTQWLSQTPKKSKCGYPKLVISRMTIWETLVELIHGSATRFS